MIRPVWDYSDRHVGDPIAPSFLTRSTHMQLRRIVHAHREGWLLEDRVERVGRMVAEDAHRDGASATQLLITLKRTWAAIDDVHGLLPQHARDLLRLVVTACVHAYYAEPSADTSAARGAGAPSEGRVPPRSGASADA